MSYVENRQTAPFGAISLYRVGSAVADAAAALSGLSRRPTPLVALSPAELEDIGLSVADLPAPRKGLVAQLAAAVRGWNARRRTVNALSRLSEAQLADIGLTRWDVEELRAGRVSRR